MGNLTFANMKTFTKYYNLQSGATQALPKFALYLSHDEIIGSFYEALGYHTVVGTMPAGALFLEFFKDTAKNNTLMVRTFMQPDINTTVNLNIKG